MIVEFDVEEQGFVNSPKIVDSSLTEYYGDLSLALIKNFRYDPLIIDGESVAVPRVRHSFFYFEDNDINGSYRIHLIDGKARLGISSFE